MSIWTIEKREKLKECIRSGDSYNEIMKKMIFPTSIGKYSLSNAIKRYTTITDRKHGMKMKRKRKSQSKSSYRKISSYYRARLTEDELETAQNSPEPLPCFHPLTWNIIMKDSILPFFYQELRPWGNSEVNDEVLQDRKLIQYLEERNL